MTALLFRDAGRRLYCRVVMLCLGAYPFLSLVTLTVKPTERAVTAALTERRPSDACTNFSVSGCNQPGVLAALSAPLLFTGEFSRYTQLAIHHHLYRKQLKLTSTFLVLLN
jgi:hypothetical protein